MKLLALLSVLLFSPPIRPANATFQAMAGPDQTVSLRSTTTATLTGQLRNTVPGSPIYAWTKVAGPAAGTLTSVNSLTTTVTGLVRGDYTFRLSASMAGAHSTDDMILTVVDNLPPIANAGADQTIASATSSATLAGTGTDPDGTVGFHWTKVAGPAPGTITSPNTATTTVTGIAEGTYDFQLTVTDNSGAPVTDVVRVVKLPVLYDVDLELPTFTVSHCSDLDGTEDLYGVILLTQSTAGTKQIAQHTFWQVANPGGHYGNGTWTNAGSTTRLLSGLTLAELRSMELKLNGNLHDDESPFGPRSFTCNTCGANGVGQSVRFIDDAFTQASINALVNNGTAQKLSFTDGTQRRDYFMMSWYESGNANDGTVVFTWTVRVTPH